MKKEYSLKKVLSFVLVLVALIVIVYIQFNPLGEGVIGLEGVEISNFEGKDLSSVNDFRENSIKGVQYVDVDNYKLKVSGLVNNEKEYSYDEVISRQSYSKVITLYCVEGWSATILWEGIILRELLLEAGPKENANTIIFHAYDGYTTSYPIDYIMGQDILMAYKMNNETIIPARGFPFVLVAEDKWGYKWIKWITEIEFSNDLSYEGYWESRGYSKGGYLNESFLK
jgi:DMSO/TMAO reductase YedYZ molybdopterin-dependent catalytic subunit